MLMSFLHEKAENSVVAPYFHSDRHLLFHLFFIALYLLFSTFVAADEMYWASRTSNRRFGTKALIEAAGAEVWEAETGREKGRLFLQWMDVT
jgi:hypothetical protein